jgi:two-component system response regulator PilR (NtrC family)
VLRHYPFHGNVRELENLMERCVALNAGGPIGKDLFPDNVLGIGTRPAASDHALDIPPDGFDLEGYLAALKGFFMSQALARADGNRTRAARLLGMSFRAYRYWLQEMGGAETLQAHFPWPDDFPSAGMPEAQLRGDSANDFL